jgi:hypothetical protein
MSAKAIIYQKNSRSPKFSIPLASILEGSVKS